MKIKALLETQEIIDNNQDKIKPWIKALSSGDYTQGDNILYSKINDRYCCLGVLESINGVIDEKLDGVTYPSILNKPTFIGGKLPQYFDFELDGYGIYLLADLNDNIGLSFNEISNLLEFGEIII